MEGLWMGSYDWTTAATSEVDDAAELRRGPWTVDEDAVLASHVSARGEGRWNELARAAGLRRTGKSCRLRWLNYLRPGVRRGDFTPREQLLVLELHSRWGNRWSRIAAHLPGRTDNEVKNYWRTRVQKHARQLGCDVGSRRFHDVMRNHWLPRLVERIYTDSAAAVDDHDASASHPAAVPSLTAGQSVAPAPPNNCGGLVEPCASSDASSATTGQSSSDSSHEAQFQTDSPIMTAAGTDCWSSTEQCQYDMLDGSWSDLLARASHDESDSAELHDLELDEAVVNFWSLDDIWLQQLC